MRVRTRFDEDPGREQAFFLSLSDMELSIGGGGGGETVATKLYIIRVQDNLLLHICADN